MAKTLDLHRRRKPAPPPPPARTDRRAGVGLFILLFVLAVIISLASNKVASDNLPASLEPSPTISSITYKTTPPTPSPTFTPLPSATPTPSPTPSATPSPSPTETTPPAEPDKSTISMRILNGSGTPGQAATLQTTLKKNGFSVRSIATAKTRRATGIIYYITGKRAEAEFVAGFVTNRVLEFEENSVLANPDTLLIIVGAK